MDPATGDMRSEHFLAQDALAVFVGKRLRDCVFYLYLEVRDEGGSAS